jgi:GntR family transcriptional regulator, transcriptional repressor for pyruvate dehydrogenase complex
MQHVNLGKTPLVSRTVSALAELSLAAAQGDYLGAEDQLLTQMAVSRPTLRQAAKILETERLVSVRRGTKGGFYAARPDASDVIRAPARYLRLNGATVADVHAATKSISEEVGALAAMSDDVDLRARLAKLRDAIEGTDTPATIIDAETALARLLGEMSGNPAARLFIEISYSFGREEQRLHFYHTTEDRARARQLQRGLCDAVLARDPDIARLMMQRRSAMIAEWLAREERLET